MLVRDPRKLSKRLVDAVLDYCKRADRPSSEGEVRLALARVGSDLDRKIASICGSEPSHHPLSPHALVDVAMGMPAEQAAALEKAGAYLAVAREAAEEATLLTAEEAPKEIQRPRLTRRRTRPGGLPTPVVRRKSEVQERRERAAPRHAEEEPSAPPPRPGRRPAAPKFGRFVEGPRAKRPFDELEGSSGRGILHSLILEVGGSSSALVERLDSSWEGPGGRRLDALVLRKLLSDHGLDALQAKAERKHLLGLLRKSRGFERPVARALGVDSTELLRLIRAHDLEETVKELRQKAKESALRETELRGKLRLLLRQGDRMRDLGILQRIERASRGQLFDALDELPLPVAVTSPDGLLEWTRRQLDLDKELWERTVEHFGLMRWAERRLGMKPSGERRGPRRP